MKPIFVGEDNPHGSDPRYALYPYPENSAGGRLCRLILQMRVTQYIGSFERTNLCSRKWSIKEARFSADRIAARVRPTDARVVLLGSKVADAFGLAFEPFASTHGKLGCFFVILPHPSGRNLMWNAPGAFSRARAVLRQAGVPLGPSSTITDDELREMPRTDCTIARPAKCANCGLRVEGEDCPDCGPIR